MRCSLRARCVTSLSRPTRARLNFFKLSRVGVLIFKTSPRWRAVLWDGAIFKILRTAKVKFSSIF